MVTKARKYGIAEWFGRAFHHLSETEKVALAQEALRPRPMMDCLPRLSCKKVFPDAVSKSEMVCNKKGGVCSTRLVPIDPSSSVVTMCPSRFYEGGMIYSWVGQELLGTEKPTVLKEVEFLQSQGKDDTMREVGNIDRVLVRKGESGFTWCALELQAVYFSGIAMQTEFQLLSDRNTQNRHPAANRRPDFRSSGPKRLMPQLQTKVPTLRRWGKKMAVVVDLPFFSALGEMRETRDKSNADICWFVVSYKTEETSISLQPERLVCTTLEHAVEGLTGGYPTTQTQFEDRIRSRIGVP